MEEEWLDVPGLWRCKTPDHTCLFTLQVPKASLRSKKNPSADLANVTSRDSLAELFKKRKNGRGSYVYVMGSTEHKKFSVFAESFERAELNDNDPDLFDQIETVMFHAKALKEDMMWLPDEQSIKKYKQDKNNK